MFNHTVTIYNKYVDTATRSYGYKKTVLKGVHWESGEGVKLGSKSVTTSDDTFLIIPFSIKVFDNYVKPNLFTNEGDLWTLQTEDIVVKGELDLNIKSIADLKGYEVGTVKKIHTVDYAFGCLNNWTLELS